MNRPSSELNLSGKDLAALLKAVCKKGVSFKLTARGTSMSPFICSGDTVIIDPIPDRNLLKPGDIIAFATPGEGRLIIHRIICMKTNCYLLKGDNVYQADGCYAPENILGRVGKIIPQKKPGTLYRHLRHTFFIFNHLKPFVAMLSRYKLLTIFCRATNRILHE